MSHTLTIRLTSDLSRWLEEVSRRTGLSQGEIIRQQLGMARQQKGQQRFLRMAGAVAGTRNLSSRTGFARS